MKAGSTFLSDAPPLERYRLTNEFTRALTDLSLKYGVAIVGGHLEPIDLAWSGPDAEKWEQYAVDEDDYLVRGFWNQHSKAIVR